MKKSWKTIAKKSAKALEDSVMKCDPSSVHLAADAQEFLYRAYSTNEINADEYEELRHNIIRPADAFRKMCRCK